MNIIVVIILIFAVVCLYYILSREKPLFKMKCDKCGETNNDWKMIETDTFHNRFIWRHNCKKRGD